LTAVPEIIGLAVGVGFIVLFGLIFGGKLATIPYHKNFSLISVPYNGSSNESTFVPKVITIVIGVNNTIRWKNHDSTPTWLEADSQEDPNFYNATRDTVPLFPNKPFEYTFTKVGEFGYHGKPWQRGKVIVVR
jgi:plastocyanin